MLIDSFRNNLRIEPNFRIRFLNILSMDIFSFDFFVIIKSIFYIPQEAKQNTYRFSFELN